MEIRNLDPNAVIKWRLTDNCNYKCEYCIRRPLMERRKKEEERATINHALFEEWKGRKDGEICLEAAPHIAEVAEKLYRNTGKKVKIDLIGGEITVLPELKEIMSSMEWCEAIEKFNITTNFYHPYEYWQDLLSVKIPVTMTVSYHPTQCKETLDEFLDKAAKVKELCLYLKCETVATFEATHIDDFIEGCKKRGLEYQVEENLADKRCVGKSCSSTKQNDRYEVIDDEGVAKRFKTRNSFLKEFGINGMTIPTYKMMCSRDYDYVYFEKDTYIPCSSISEIKKVDKWSPCKDYHECYRSMMTVEGSGRPPMCTLCGNMSIKSMEKKVDGSC